jgi:flagellar basal-body rod modification protein FlgD
MTVSPPAATAVTPTSATSTPSSSSNSSSSSSSSSTGGVSIANNFNTFLTLLTTQLKNQNPLDPLNTNQFTQQLVQFAQVEQQMKSNDQLTTLVSLQKTAETTQALGYVGKNVVVNGATTSLANGKASWTLTTTKPATGSLSITNSAGQLVYTRNVSLNAGTQTFTWDGRNTSGAPQPDGPYTISIAATDANKQAVSVSTQSKGTVDSVDMTQTPPVISVNGQNYSLDQIQQVVN